jgi:hypothetical protein
MPTNKDRLVNTFALYNLTLSEDDKKAIDKRNDYLHGRHPLQRKLQFELTQISQRLHTLIISLLLKAVGYSGHVVNLHMQALLNDEERFHKLVADESVGYIELIKRIELAREKQDIEGFNLAKEELGKRLEESKIDNLVRII